jgi:hypothetical protein
MQCQRLCDVLIVKFDSRSIKPEFGVVRLLDNLVFGLEGVDHDYRSEDLFFHDWRVFGLVGEDDWLDQEWPFGALVLLRRCIGVWFAELDVSLDSVVLRLIGLRSVIDLSLCRVAERSTASQLPELFDERRFDAALHVYAAVRHAAKEHQHVRISVTSSKFDAHHVCPLFQLILFSVSLTACSISASSNTIAGPLPPSSKITFFKFDFAEAI